MIPQPDQYALKAIDEISRIERYHDLYAACFRRLGLLSKGGSRAVFDAGNGCVLKVAISHSGVFQNAMEDRISLGSPTLRFFEKAWAPLESMKVVVMRRAERLPEASHFNAGVGVSYESVCQFSTLLSRHILCNRSVSWIEDEIERNLPLIQSERVLKEIAHVSDVYSVLLGDLNKLDSWGVFGGEIKAVDYGLEPLTFRLFGNNEAGQDIDRLYHGSRGEKRYTGPIDIGRLSDFYWA